MKRIPLILLMSLATLQSVQAQVKIAPTAGVPDASSVLELESTTKGFLPPRVTTSQRNAINSPAIGLVVYNTERSCLETFDGGGWGCIGSSDVPKSGRLGSTFTTAHGSASTAFSTNTRCSNKAISAGYTTSTCKDSITVGVNTYHLVHINGQCWLKTNLKEFPSMYGGYTSISWLNTATADKGYWGYYNISISGGSAGWGSTEPASGEGLLYQWSAAMNGSNTERAQGVCPRGFHLPSDCEWMFLEHGLGMRVSFQISFSSWRSLNNSNNVGSQLSNFASGGTNSSGWSGQFAGWRNNSNGAFVYRNVGGRWWTSTPFLVFGEDEAYMRRLSNVQVGVYRHRIDQSAASSVRCLKD